MRLKKATLWLAIGVLGVGVWRWTRGPAETPAQRFAALQQRIAAGLYDHEQALASFDSALSEAEELGASELAVAIRLARGKLFMELGAYDRARSDLEQVLQQQSGERAIEELLIDLEARAGDFRAGLARTARLIEADPAYAGARRRGAELHQLAAERLLDQCAARIELALVPDDARAANALCARAAALDPKDARRVAIEHDLREIFGFAEEKAAEEVLRATDLASEDLRAARAGYAESLEIAFEPRALARLLDLLVRAGRVEESVDLASAALRVPAVRTDLDTAHFLLRALADLERYGYASWIAGEWLNSSRAAPPEFWLDCLRVLYPARDYNQVVGAAQRLFAVANPVEQDICKLYIGLGLIGGGDWSGGRSYLSRYLSTTSPEPFPNARALAWREVARASRELGDEHGEREALQGAVELEPDYSGELWLRLADLQLASPHGGYRVPETRWAVGMSMLPRRTAELLPRWREVGDLELKSSGLDVEGLRQDLASGKSPSPNLGPSAYELYTFANLHLAAGDPIRAAEYAEQLLREVPRFVPAIDLALSAALAMGRQRDALDCVLQRLAAVGLDERNAAILRAVPPDRLTAADLVTILRSDPERTGRLAIARTSARNGAHAEALAMLERAGIEQLGEGGRVLAAELALALRQPEKALELLAPLEPKLAGEDPALVLYVDAALQVGARETLGPLIARIATEEEPVRETWIALADRLLAGGSPRAAEALLRRLERGRPKLRGGDVIVRLAATALARADLPTAEAAAERAQAFDNRGENELVALLVTIDGHHFDELKTAVAALRSTDLKLTPLQQAALDALAGKSAPAETAIANALQRDPTDPLWQIVAVAARSLAGTSHAPDPLVFGAAAPADFEKLALLVDARTMLGWIVALPARLGAGWVQAELGGLAAETTGNLWRGYVEAALAEQHGFPARAQRLYAQLVEAHPDSRPAWDRLEQLLATSAATQSEREELHARRQTALRGESTDAPVDPIELGEHWLDQALAFQRSGELDAALRSVRKAAEIAPESSSIQARLGEIAARRGEFAESIGAWRKVCLAAAPTPNLPATAAYLGVLRDAARASPPVITLAQWNDALEALQARHPADPRIVAAQAQLDLERPENNPTFLVARAYARLKRFRESHAEIALENLAAGSTAAWVEFYLALEPARAEALLERELTLEPGSLVGWAMLGRVRAAAGKPKQAIEDLAFAQRLAPSGAVLREYMRVKLRGDWSVEAAEAMVEQVMRLEDRTTPDPELAALHARAHFNLGLRGSPRAIEILEGVFNRGDLSPSDAQRIGRDYAVALLARGSPEDGARAREVLQAIETSTIDPYERDLLRACKGLARPAGTEVANAEVVVKPQ